jgi:hypothetical protein
MAVSSSLPQIHKDLFCLHLDDVRFSRKEEKCRSVKKDLNKRWIVPEALSPQMQVAYAPVIRDPTHLKTRIEPFYGPQPAIAYVHLRFHMESRCCCHLGTELGQIDDIHHSAKDNISKQWTVP